MSAYRHVCDEGYSYSACVRDYSLLAYYEDYTKFYKGILTYAYRYCKIKPIIISEKMYVKFNICLKKNKGEKWLRYLVFNLDIHHKYRVLFFIIYKSIINIFKRIKITLHK